LEFYALLGLGLQSVGSWLELLWTEKADYFFGVELDLLKIPGLPEMLTQD